MILQLPKFQLRLLWKRMTKMNHFSGPIVRTTTVLRLGMLQVCLVEVLPLMIMLPEAILVELFRLAAIKNTMQTNRPQGNQFNMMIDLVRPL